MLVKSHSLFKTSNKNTINVILIKHSQLHTDFSTCTLQSLAIVTKSMKEAFLRLPERGT